MSRYQVTVNGVSYDVFSPADGTVATVNVGKGASVNTDDVIISIA